MDISNANLDQIYQWVNNEASDSYIKREFTSGFELTSFISKIENCSQIESAKLISEKYSIAIPEEFIKFQGP